MARLTVATCQLPTRDDVARNATNARRLLRRAARAGARLAHFPEACLSGYPGSDRASLADLDFAQQRRELQRLATLCGELGLWLVIGAAHPLTGGLRPHNSLYVFDDHGVLVDRYDKRFCMGDPEATAGDLAHYSPGDHPVTIEVDGVRCGLLICYEARFPELYRQCRKDGVQLVLQSFHAAHSSPELMAELADRIGPEHLPLNHGATYAAITQHACATAAAAANHFWLSCANSAAQQSHWGSFVIRADGVTVGRLPRNRAGVLLTVIDTELDLYDSARHWRERAMAGVLHSGTLVDDDRSRDRRSL